MNKILLILWILSKLSFRNCFEISNNNRVVNQCIN